MIILDTHAWIWWTNESTKLTPYAKEKIQEADSIGISAISCWELAMLVTTNNCVELTSHQRQISRPKFHTRGSSRFYPLV